MLSILSTISLDKQGEILLNTLLPNQPVLSNIPLKHDHTLVKIGHPSLSKSKTWRNSRLIIPSDNIRYNINHPFERHALFIEYMAPKSDEIILIFPPTRVDYLLVLLAKAHIPKVHVIAGKPIPDITVDQTLKESLGTLKRRYNVYYDKYKRPIEYRPDQLTQTPNGGRLRPYQQQMMDFVLERKRVGLFVDMGLGKTLVTLTTLNKLAEEGRIDISKPVLVVAPLMVAVDTWSREADKWGYDFDVEINIRLSTKKRQELLDRVSKPLTKLTLVTTNPNQLEKINNYYQEKCQPSPFQVVVVDELSMFKAYETKRAQALQLLSRNAEYFIGLTGTPAPNSLLDVWCQLILIDSKNMSAFGANKYQYLNMFFQPDARGRDGRVYSWALKPLAQYEIYDRMRQTVISMRSTGLIDLPDIVYTDKYVTLPAKAMKTYRELDSAIRKKLVETEETVEADLDGASIDIANSAVLSGKLCQLSSGAIYTEDRQYTVFHDVKFQLLKELVETATSPLLIFYYFTSELERMREYFDFEHLDPDNKNMTDLISRWNKGQVPVMATHPISTSRGLNLQDGGHTIIWLTTTWSNEVYRQANKRLHRSGQTSTVNIIHIVAKGTIDEEIISRIDRKEEGQSQLMKALDVGVRPNKT